MGWTHRRILWTWGNTHISIPHTSEYVTSPFPPLPEKRLSPTPDKQYLKIRSFLLTHIVITSSLLKNTPLLRSHISLIYKEENDMDFNHFVWY